MDGAVEQLALTIAGDLKSGEQLGKFLRATHDMTADILLGGGDDTFRSQRCTSSLQP